MTTAWVDGFDGVDLVAWESMHHAYGKAGDVPGVLRDLISADAEKRELAVEHLWHSVHHQGDIYDSTVAAIPFLVTASAWPDFPERADVLTLLAGIGAAGLEVGADDLEAGDAASAEAGENEDAAGEDWAHLAVRAHAAVLDGVPGYLDGLAAQDAEVRGCAAGVLAICAEQRALILPALREAAAGERDPVTQIALIDACARSSSPMPTRVSSPADEPTTQWLLGLFANARAPHVRLAAMVQIATRAPRYLPPAVADVAVALADELFAASYSDDAEEWRVPLLGDLVEGIHNALDDRLPERIALVTHELSAAQAGRRADGARMALWLMRDFRADYTLVVRTIGEQLADPEPGVRAMAAHTVKDLGVLAAPAADALVACLAGAPQEAEYSEPGVLTPCWVNIWPSRSPTMGTLVMALARARDARVLPILQACLDRPAIPWDLGPAISAVGPAAAGLADSICARLQAMRGQSELNGTRKALAAALTAIGAAATPEAMPELVAMLDEEDTSVQAVLLLGQLGDAASSTSGKLARFLVDPDERIALYAATALSRVAPDDALLRPVFERWLSRPDGQGFLEASDGLALLGGGSPVVSAAMSRMLESSYSWHLVAGATLAWYTADDADTAMPALARAWSTGHYCRRRVATLATDIGSAAAPLEGLLSTELASLRRHNRPAGSNTYSSAGIQDDEDLLRQVRAALGSIAGHDTSAE